MLIKHHTFSIAPQTIASAATTDLASKEADVIVISGTTTITSFGAGAGLTKQIIFSGALTLTHNATTLILPGGANIATLAGDMAIATSDASGNWRVLTYTRGGKTLILHAGSSTEAPLKFQAGTNLGTAQAGAVEYDGEVFWGTPKGTGRGVIAQESWQKLPSNYALTSTTSLQKLLNVSANGALSLEQGNYFFQAAFYITGLSATSGNAQFDVLGGGTAVLNTAFMHLIGKDDNAPLGALAQDGSFAQAGASAASLVIAGTGSQIAFSVRGTFRIGTAGTIIPSIALVTAAAGSVRQGSYFTCRRVGPEGTYAMGPWS